MGIVIAIILIVGSLIGMGIIVIRKFPQLSIVEVESIKSEREAKIKRDILIQRLKRLRAERFLKIFKTLIPILGPLAKKIKVRILSLYQKILDIERKHKEIKLKENGKTASGIEGFLEEASELIKKDNLKEAEKKYLEAINFDYKNIDSYEGLGAIYLKRKEYKEAKETLEFVLKLDSDRPDIYFSLAEASVGLGNGDEAMEFLNKALGLEPNNPKYLDFLIEVAIMSKNYRVARKTLEKLKEVNPDNQKIKDFEIRLKSLGRAS